MLTDGHSPSARSHAACPFGLCLQCNGSADQQCVAQWVDSRCPGRCDVDHGTNCKRKLFLLKMSEETWSASWRLFPPCPLGATTCRRAAISHATAAWHPAQL